MRSPFHRQFPFLGIVLLSAWVLASEVESNAVNSVIPPQIQEVKFLPPSLSTDRQVYEFEVIKAALEATRESHGPYKLSSWDGGDMNLLRTVREIARGEVVNVGTNPLSGELINEDIDIIPIPLMKGLLGYRAMIVRVQDVKRLSEIENVEALRKLKLGQLDYWSDIAVYEANDFEVVRGANMEVLFSMLERERFDYIPLGVGEVETIFASLQEKYPGLTILPASYLYYPFPVYTYVCTCEPAIKQRLEAGLRTINKNGVLENLFTKQFGDAMDKIQARRSKIFRIENAAIPEELLPEKNAAFSISTRRQSNAL